MTVNKRLNAEELEAIRKRTEDTSFERAYVKGDPWKGYEVRNDGNGMVVAETSTKVDAEFIAHAREDVPKLLAEIEYMNGVIGGLKSIFELIEERTEGQANEIAKEALEYVNAELQ
jgi:hypothetical protein